MVCTGLTLNAGEGAEGLRAGPRQESDKVWARAPASPLRHTEWLRHRQERSSSHRKLTQWSRRDRMVTWSRIVTERREEFQDAFERKERKKKATDNS